MVGVIARMRKLKTTWNIRNGLGAAVFPAPESSPSPVTRIHLSYARKMYQGHIGARRFWRECLPRLKYYNPSVAMTVQQTEKNELPAWLTIYFDKGATIDGPAETELKDEHAPKPTEAEKIASIDIRHLNASNIMSQVRRLTGAKDVAISNEDVAEQAERRIFERANEKMKAKQRRDKQSQEQFQAIVAQAMKQTR